MIILDDFSNLTQFVHEEFMKIQQTYGLSQVDQKNLKKMTNTILTAFNISNSTTKKKLKYYAKIDWAIFTAPHSWLWKICHSKLWKKAKEEMKRREEEAQRKDNVSEPQELAPGAPTHVPVDLEAMSLPGTVDPAQRLLNSHE